MTIELKIEVLKVFKLEFSMSSENKKRVKDSAKESDFDQSADKQSGKS